MREAIVWWHCRAPLIMNIAFRQSTPSGPVAVEISGSGFTPGKVFAIHVHEKAPPDVGGHFNPGGGAHGGFASVERHAGDLMNNVAVDRNGRVHARYVDDTISLFPGSRCIVGRGVVVHSGADDGGLGGRVFNSLVVPYEDDHKVLASQVNGNAGEMEFKGLVVLQRNGMVRRYLVGLLYVLYAVAIGVWWGVQEVVMACLGLHMLGVLYGLFRADEYEVYPVWRNAYFAFDIVQFAMLVACAYDPQLTEAAAVVALVGVAMCIAKVAAVSM